MKLKKWQNISHVTVNANAIVQHVIQIKNGVIKHVHVKVKIIINAEEIIVGFLAQSIGDSTVVAWDGIISVMNIVWTKNINTIATNVTKNCRSKKVRYKINCYILYTVLLAIILILLITIIWYHYT